MPRGGTRAGAGRPPDPDSLRALDREEDYGAWTELPKSGRTGRVPAWPLPTPTNPSERKQWDRLWKTPQAIMWEKLGQQVPVALYVRRMIEAQERGATSSLTNAVLRMQDSLGITPHGMRSLRWKIVDREAIQKAQDSAATRKRPKAGSSSKTRLTVVRDDG